MKANDKNLAIKDMKDFWGQPSGGKCPSHGGGSSILREKTWEDPCPFCLIFARKQVFPEDHCRDDHHTPTANNINLYLKFLTHPSPRLDFYMKILNQFRDGSKPELTVEDEVFRTVAKALRQGIWQAELSLEDGTAEKPPDSGKPPTPQVRELLAYRFDLIAEWYLRRYQIFAAWKMYQLGKREDYAALPDEGLPGLREPLSFLCLAVLIYMLLVFGSFSVAGFSWLSFAALGVALPVGLCTGLNHFLDKKHSLLRLLLPQQLGAILAGYFLLIIIGAEYWDLLVRTITEFPLACLIPPGLFALIFLYLVWEVKSQLGFYNRNRAWKHALTVAMIGCLESLAIGCMVFNLFGPYMESLFSDFKFFLRVDALCFHQIIFVATYMTLALFVGIFLQIFWQDKPITVSL